MEIFRLIADVGEYKSVGLVNNDKAFLKQFRNDILMGRALNGKYDYIELEIVDGKNDSDFIMLWSVMGIGVFSCKAKQCLEDVMKNCVEFIPARLKNEIVYITNVISILDAIDIEKSKIQRLKTGLIIGLEEYCFVSEKISDNNFFKILLNNSIYTTEIFVTSEFRAIVEKNNLLGFSFEKVWQSDI